MKRILNKHFLKHLLLFLVIIAGMSVFCMLLWNLIVPDIFKLPALNLWQAGGLLILTRIFFGGFGHGMFFRRHGNAERGFHHDNMLFKKWETMTPEQREEFLNRRRDHFRHEHFKFNRDPKSEDGKNNGK